MNMMRSAPPACNGPLGLALFCLAWSLFFIKASYGFTLLSQGRSTISTSDMNSYDKSRTVVFQSVLLSTKKTQDDITNYLDPRPLNFREAEVLGLRFMQEGRHEDALKGTYFILYCFLMFVFHSMC